jgi:hypothetical protein
MVWAVLNADQNAALIEIQHSNSDRITAVLGAAILDDSLQRAMEYRLRAKDGKTDMNEKLFRITWPLGNLGPKIDLAYQLYMFDKPIRNAMYGISEIRNLFAHNLAMSFSSEDDRMKTAFGKMRAHDTMKKYPVPAIPPDDVIFKTPIYDVEKVTDRRSHFTVELKLSLMWLMGDYQRHAPYSNHPHF